MPRKRGLGGGVRRGNGGGRFRRGNFKRQGKKKQNQNNVNQEFSELMDFDGISQNQEGSVSFSSKKSHTKHKLQDESENTRRNRKTLFERQLRNKPVEFVKSKEIYDPSRLLNLQLKGKDYLKSVSELDEEILQSMPTVESVFEIDDKLINSDEKLSEKQRLDIYNSIELDLDYDDDDDDDDDDDEEESESSDEESTKNLIERDKAVENILSGIRNDELLVDIDHEKVSIKEITVKSKDDHDIVIEDCENINMSDSPTGINLERPKVIEEMQSLAIESSSEFEMEDDSESVIDEQLFFVDDQGNDTFAEKNKKSYTEILQEKRQKELLQPEPEIIFKNERLYKKVAKAHLETDDTLYVGKVAMSTHTDENTGEMYVDLKSRKKKMSRKFHDDYDYENDLPVQLYINNIMKKALHPSSDDDEVRGDEYDEFEFDDDGNLSENELSNAVSESSSEEKEEAEDADYLFKYAEEFGDDLTLDEFMSFGKGMKENFTDGQFENKSIQYRGKGKNKKPILEHIDDSPLYDDLMAQFQTHRLSKADKRKMRKEHKKQIAEEQNDLKIKYPYGLHINEIKAEFESLMRDKKRNTVDFPPMDPHGNKTLKKMCLFYGLKAHKFGQGNDTHVVALKHKRTYNSFPDYDSINRILKQRRVFNRIDVKKPAFENLASGKKINGKEHSKTSGANIKEGEVVGAKAPVIDQNNIGRIMLEKLGWVSGEGLGAEHNKGISEPLTTKVKRNKVGIK